MDDLDYKEVQRRFTLTRDRKYRRLLLSALFATRGSPSSWTSATKLRDAVKDQPAEDPEQEHDQYWICLLRDLCIKGLVEERRRKIKRTETFSLKHLRYRLLSPGLSLCLGSTPPDPDIDDDRVVLGTGKL